MRGAGRDAESEIGIGASATGRREKQRGRKDEAVFFSRNFRIVDGSGKTASTIEISFFTCSFSGMPRRVP